MRIGLDAMGGDKAPWCPVKGAIAAVNEFGYDVTLVGKEKEIKKHLKGAKYPQEKIDIYDTSQVIEMHDPAAVSVRKKRDSSIVKGMDLLKKGKVDAFVSAGNTGAVVVAATLSLRLLPGVDRPGIGVIFPTLTKPSLVMDVGANIDSKPLHLFQYGIMGDSFCKYIMKKRKPSIALINIGEESTKGTDCIKEAHAMLMESNLNFIGNIEPKDVYYGKADVVICDGFIGNVFLKVTEGFADAASTFLRREFKNSNLLTKMGALIVLPAFKKLKKKVNANEYGGAPLMGIDGSVIIGHGSSSSEAIKNAIRAAAENVKQEVNKHIVEELNSF